MTNDRTWWHASLLVASLAIASCQGGSNDVLVTPDAGANDSVSSPVADASNDGMGHVEPDTAGVVDSSSTDSTTKDSSSADSSSGDGGDDGSISTLVCTDSAAAFTTSEAEGQWSNGGYFVRNDAWNSDAGPQTLYACSYDSWNVVANEPSTTDVKTYPDV